MKKLLSSLLLCSVLFTILPTKKAEASIGICLTAGTVAYLNQNNPNRQTLTKVFGIIYGVSFVSTVAGMIIGMPFMFILDENSDQLEVIAAGISTQYPFIENSQVVAEFSKALQAKFVAANANEAQVSLTEAELAKILAPADLTEEQFSTIVNDLK